MYAKNVERAGGARDESEVYIGYTADELVQMFIRIERKYGVHFAHDFPYTFKDLRKPSPLPVLWRKIKKQIRKFIDGEQLTLPLY